MTSLYDQAGYPINGPRTTAAEAAHDVVAWSEFEIESDAYSTTRLLVHQLWREAAAYEGRLYAQAIRYARADRQAAYSASHAHANRLRERRLGLPVGWFNPARNLPDTFLDRTQAIEDRAIEAEQRENRG